MLGQLPPANRVNGRASQPKLNHCDPGDLGFRERRGAMFNELSPTVHSVLRAALLRPKCPHRLYRRSSPCRQQASSSPYRKQNADRPGSHRGVVRAHCEE